MANEPRQTWPTTLFFVGAGLLHVCAVASRFDVTHSLVPPLVDLALVVAHVPLVLIEGLLLLHLAGDGVEGKRVSWVQIRSGSGRVALTFGFTFLGIVLLQAWDLEIGPIDPTPPESFPLATRARYFATMTVAMFFPNFLAATSFVLPIVRALTFPWTRPLSPLSLFSSASVLGAIGIAGGFGLVVLLLEGRVGALVASAQGAIYEGPALAIAVALLTTVLLPGVVSWVGRQRA